MTYNKYCFIYAGVAELADARDLKSRVLQRTYRFKSGLRHQINKACCNIAGT